MTSNYLLSQNSQGLVPTMMTNILKWTTQKDLISFAGGMPDPSLFPLKEIIKATEKVAQDVGSISLQYCSASGHEGLRDYFQQHFSSKGIHVKADNIIPVCGVQQGVSFTSQLFLDSGDKILITSPSYFGALQTFDAFLVNYLTIDLTENGIDLDKLEQIFQKEKIKFFYLIPNFQNPSGISIHEYQRPLIAQLAVKYNIIIVEDDVFWDLYFEKAFTPLKSFAPNNVIYLTGLSKTISSGLRIGFIVPPRELIQKYILLKQLNDVNLNTFSQYIIYEICKNGTFKNLLPYLRDKYCERKNALLKSLEKYCSKLAVWTKPTGGMFLWLYLYKDIDSNKLLEYSANKGLVFLPGSAFFPYGQGGKSEIRLSFSNLDPEKIDFGIQKLSEYIQNYK